jgi:hypothetical protein
MAADIAATGLTMQRLAAAAAVQQTLENVDSSGTSLPLFALALGRFAFQVPNLQDAIEFSFGDQGWM